MKLLKCHIENFGKLSNFNFDFSKGLNIINEENGWGKSTFATFIKAMFYGLPSTSKRNLDENERKKYNPWQGGNYGGNIDFEIMGQNYRIERFFGKNNSEDSFELINLSTGKKSKDYSENIGEEIFGLDSDAFERSSFIPQKSLNSQINESMSNKLTNLIQGTNESFNLEDALRLLDKKRSRLENKQNSGQIQNLEGQREDIISKIQELYTSTLAIDEIQKQVEVEDEKIDKLIIEQKEIKKKITDYSKISENLARKELYQKLENNVKKSQEELLNKKGILNNNNTSLTEVNSYISLSRELSKKEDRLKTKKDENYLEDRLEELKVYFREGKPSDDELKTINEKISKYNLLKVKSESNTAVEKKGKNILPILLTLLSIIFIVVGVFLIKPMQIVGIICFVLGALSLLLGGFLYLRNMINLKTSNNNNITSSEMLEMKNLQSEIESFLNKYESHENYLLTLNNIYSNKKELENLESKIDNYSNDIFLLEKEILEEKEKIKKYLNKFNLESVDDGDKLEILKQTIIDIANIRDRIVTEQEEFEEFKKEKSIENVDLEYEMVDINILQAQEQQLQEEIDEERDIKSKMLAKIGKIQDDISGLDDLENQREELTNNIEELTKELSNVKNAIKYLKSADESLSSKLLEPMKKGLVKYLKLITSKDFDNLLIDTDFNISFDEYGKSREVDYYSKGYKNTFDLSMRLAFIDSLFDKERPFIVLDDPFVNMDEGKIENAKRFLRELSKEYQVIYFSCHKSRI